MVDVASEKNETAFQDLELGQIEEMGRFSKFFRVLNAWIDRYQYDDVWCLMWAEPFVHELRSSLAKVEPLVLSERQRLKAIKTLDNKGRKCRECRLVVERDDATQVSMTVSGPGRKYYHALWHDVCAPTRLLDLGFDEDGEGG